jgi:nucleoid DNA-binding protein
MKGTTKLRRLVEPLFAKTTNPRAGAETVIDYLVTVVTSTLLVERKVSIRRLGMFELRATPAKGPIPAGWRVIFTPSDCLKQQIKEHFNGRPKLQTGKRKAGRRSNETRRGSQDRRG